MLKVLGSAVFDIRAGLKKKKVWLALASEDIGDQHRRTALGPLWLLINYLLFAGAFIVIFGHEQSTPNFPAYVATGLFVWLFISETITLSTSLFAREESFIKGTTLPLSVYVMRLVMQSVIRAGYALLGCIAILLLSGTPLTVGWLWSGLALLMLLATAPAAVIFFAFLGAYFPDMQFIVSNLMRLGIFVTPIFWMHDGSGSSIRGVFYYWNPFTYFLESVRVPIMSGDLPFRSYALCAAISLALWLLALLLLGKYRKQIVFVL
jgi:ABC-type polysaccharide/polyol phosphate export permease